MCGDHRELHLSMLPWFLWPLVWKWWVGWNQWNFPPIVIRCCRGSDPKGRRHVLSKNNKIKYSGFHDTVLIQSMWFPRARANYMKNVTSALVLGLWSITSILFQLYYFLWGNRLNSLPVIFPRRPWSQRKKMFSLLWVGTPVLWFLFTVDET